MVARCWVVRTGSFLNMVDTSSLIVLLLCNLMGGRKSNGNATGLSISLTPKIASPRVVAPAAIPRNKALIEYFCPRLGYFEQSCTNNGSIATSIAKATGWLVMPRAVQYRSRQN